MKTMIALLAGAMLMMATSAMALTIGPNGTYMTAVNGEKLYDTGAEAVILTDTDGTNDTLTAFLMLEMAGYASTNKLGIYGYTQNGSAITLGNTLEVFSGDYVTGENAKLQFDLTTGKVNKVGDTTFAYIGRNFGFYIDSRDGGDDGGLFYSHSYLNADKLDHFKIYNTSSSGSRDISSTDVVLGIEDLTGLDDKDYDDMVVGVSDVTPVPEPGTMMLLGAGFLGLAIYGKRRKNA